MTVSKRENLGYVVFYIEGGIGKHIIATIVLRGIKSKFPDKKIIVVAGWPDVFRNNPHVHQSYAFSNCPHVYENFVFNNKGIVLKAEPYILSEYVNPALHGDRVKHLAEIWCEHLEVPFDGLQPDIYLTSDEYTWGKNVISSKKKPVFMIQFDGGIVRDDGKQINQHVRSIPFLTAHHIAKDMSKTHHVILMKIKGQMGWQGSDTTDGMSLRQTMSLFPFIQNGLFIDSCGQHMAAAFKKRVVVCWCGTSPDQLGYPLHINLRKKVCPTPECNRPYTFLTDVQHNQQFWECPYGKPCTHHDINLIKQAIGRIL